MIAVSLRVIRLNRGRGHYGDAGVRWYLFVVRLSDKLVNRLLPVAFLFVASAAIIQLWWRSLSRLSCAFRLAVVFSLLTAAVSPVDADTLRLRRVGPPRPLQGPIFGASTTHFKEHLLGDPAKIAVLKTMAIGLDRFPGGSDANFYNWRTGMIEIQARPDSSPYVRFWANAAVKIAQAFPHGITLEEYTSFSQQIGAQVILVPNLESSSIAEQVEWFKRLAGEGAVPRRIELGNEFWVAMGNDPASLAHWPDEPTTMRIMKQYADAIKPYLPADAKLAVQAATGALDVPEHPRARFWQRLRQWDEDLRPEPWFDAVTLHLYPRLRDVMGDPQAGVTPPTTENAMPRLKAMMARVDEGVERILQDTERRLPGKEIWVTEWNPRGANEVVARGGAVEPTSPAMVMLLTTRMALVYLRHPSVTASLFFEFDVGPRNIFAMFLPDGRGSYSPLPAAAALRWLSEAANGGGTFQRVVRAGAQPIAGGGRLPESYFSVEGGLFQSGGRRVLILQNASPDTFSYDPSDQVPGKLPSKIEFMSMPNLADTTKQAARIDTQNPQGLIKILPFSVTRITW